ncbi:aspartic proteinase nepenthesin-2-like [Cryptomeria japonica]|uniref:aspartic proteinase nepenthesin-2-like n=1 Tax=Cryptomeria japonica TaxID=3369 RepID=UPI0025AB70D9|nr:aspartic proteinase nepenthesin-2-like [Cryptomeria japonica]
MESCKLLGVLAFICFIIPVMSSSSGRQFNVWSKLRVNLTRISEGESNLTERLREAVDRGKKRLNTIEASVKQQIAGQLDAETPIHVGSGEFLMSVAVGTPSVSFEAIVDTGSDLIWTQCLPCQNCYNQPTPIFDPSQSSSYSTVPCTDSVCDALGAFQSGCNPDCTFDYTYGSGETSGDLAYESFSIGSGSDSMVPGLAFGCGHDNQGTGLSQGGGLVGLGRGALSLISQLGSKVDNKFSYCLLPITDSISQTRPLIFGEGASLIGANTIPLIKNSNYPSFWYIPVTGITLNGNPVNIPTGTFDLQSDGSGGMIIDSGTSYTYLIEPAYTSVKEAIQSAIDLTPTDGSSVDLDLCYQTSGQVTLPALIFNFEGGVDYVLPADNLFIRVSDDLLCLAMLGTSRKLSIFGNVQQQNFHILYDNAQNTLSFKPTKCDSL